MHRNRWGNGAPPGVKFGAPVVHVGAEVKTGGHTVALDGVPARPPQVKAAPAAIPPPPEPPLGYELGRALPRWDVDAAAHALVADLLPQLARDLGLPARTSVVWFRSMTPAERGMHRMDWTPFRTCLVPVGVAGCVAAVEPTVIWLRAGLDLAEVPEVLAHEARHVQQMARHGAAAVARERATFEADATTYGQTIGAAYAGRTHHYG